MPKWLLYYEGPLCHHQFKQQKTSYYTYFYVCNRKINDNWHWYCGDPKKKEWCQSILAIAAAATGINGGVISQKMRIAYSSSSNVGGRRRSTNGRRTNRHRIRTDGTAAAATCVCTYYYYILLTQCACYTHRYASRCIQVCAPPSHEILCWTLVNDSQSLSVDVWNLNSRVY